MRAIVIVAVVSACGGSPQHADDTEPPDAADSDADVVMGDGGENLVDPTWPADVPLEAGLDFPPYLNLLDGTTVVVSWRTTNSTTGTVRFGTTPAKGTEAASTASANLHHVTLQNLKPGSAYYYEVAITGTSIVRQGVFVMPGRTEWRFAQFSEFHAPSESANVAKFTPKIREFRPHVIVETGDMVDDGNDLSHWRSYMRTSAPWISNVLLLPSHSNHVNGNGGNATLKDLFVIPNNERWYATRYGQAQFLNIDSHESGNSDIETTEVPWVGTMAAQMHDGAEDPTFVIASWHHPACSSQYFTRQGERGWVQDNLVAAFKNNGGIDLILVGHDKYFERSTITGGIVHVMTNIGNISPEIPGGNHSACTAVKTNRNTQSTLFVDVAGKMMSARVVDQNGMQIDGFTIMK